MLRQCLDRDILQNDHSRADLAAKLLTRRQAEAVIFQYITGLHNARRHHSYLGGICPLAFEAKVAYERQVTARKIDDDPVQ